MLLVYASRTSNIKRIIEKLGLPAGKLLDISDGYEGIVNRKFILFTYTDILGLVPEVVEKFLDKNSKNLVAVAGSGNRNFGNNFCGAAVKISNQYNVKLLAKFELAGNDTEINNFKQQLSLFN